MASSTSIAMAILLGFAVAQASTTCERRNADILIGIETSDLISPTQFTAMKKTVRKLMCRLKSASTVQNQMRIAVFSFADEVYDKDKVTFRDSKEKKKLREDVNNLKLVAAKKPNMLAPVEFVNKFFDDNKRSDTHRRFVYVGTGNSSHDVYSAAFSAARKTAIYANQYSFVISVGAQDAKSTENLKRIAESSRHMAAVGSGQVDTFQHIVNWLYPYCRKCYEPKIDVVILWDNAHIKWSSDTKFDHTKKVIKSFIERMSIGPQDTRVAVVPFGPQVYETKSFGFDEYSTNDTLLAAIDQMTRTASSALNMTKAWTYAKDTVFTDENARADVEKMIFAFTEDPQIEQTKALVASIRAMGIQTFVVGIDSYGRDFKDVAGDNYHVFDGRGVSQEGSWMLTQLPRELGRRSCISAVFAPLH